MSPEDLDKLDPEIFEALLIYDSVIEPNGGRVEQIRFANLCHLILMSSGNLTEEGMKRAKVEDWDLFGLLSNKSTKLIAEEAAKAKEEQKQRNFNALAESIKEVALKGKKDGKK